MMRKKKRRMIRTDRILKMKKKVKRGTKMLAERMMKMLAQRMMKMLAERMMKMRQWTQVQCSACPFSKSRDKKSGTCAVFLNL